MDHVSNKNSFLLVTLNQIINIEKARLERLKISAVKANSATRN